MAGIEWRESNMSITIVQGYDRIRDVFESNLNVNLVAEDISTCSLDDDTMIIRKKMKSMNFDIYGVEDNGTVIGYVNIEKLGEGLIRNYYKKFRLENLISESTSLMELLDLFQERDYAFILEGSLVRKIVTIADLHKHPIRMLAFSLISLLEMYLTTTIKDFYPNEEWTEFISDKRMEAARGIYNLRLEKNVDLTLLDSTQLADKGRIVIKTPELLGELGFESIRKCKGFFNAMEDLRNNTAHSQEMIYSDNQKLIEIILQLRDVLESSALNE